MNSKYTTPQMMLYESGVKKLQADAEFERG